MNKDEEVKAEATGELELIGGSFAVQTDKWPASCFPLGAAAAVVGNRLQEVSPFHAFSAARKQALLFIVWVERGGESRGEKRRGESRGGEGAVGTRERGRESEWDGGRERARE